MRCVSMAMSSIMSNLGGFMGCTSSSFTTRVCHRKDGGVGVGSRAPSPPVQRAALHFGVAGWWHPRLGGAAPNLSLPRDTAEEGYKPGGTKMPPPNFPPFIAPASPWRHCPAGATSFCPPKGATGMATHGTGEMALHWPRKVLSTPQPTRGVSGYLGKQLKRDPTTSSWVYLIP